MHEIHERLQSFLTNSNAYSQTTYLLWLLLSLVTELFKAWYSCLWKRISCSLPHKGKGVHTLILFCHCAVYLLSAFWGWSYSKSIKNYSQIRNYFPSFPCEISRMKDLVLHGLCHSTNWIITSLQGKKTGVCIYTPPPQEYSAFGLKISSSYCTRDSNHIC